MVVKSATKKKLMDMGIPEEVAHLLAEDRKWEDTDWHEDDWENAAGAKDIRNLSFDHNTKDFVNVIRPVMNHYPFKNAPVENLMLWHGIIRAGFNDLKYAYPTLRPELPEEAVFYTGVGHVMYLGGGSPPAEIKNRLKQYVEGSSIPNPPFDPTNEYRNIESKRLRFEKAWSPVSLHHNSINYKVVLF